MYDDKAYTLWQVFFARRCSELAERQVQSRVHTKDLLVRTHACVEHTKQLEERASALLQDVARVQQHMQAS
jgi:hypothetical protein